LISLGQPGGDRGNSTQETVGLVVGDEEHFPAVGQIQNICACKNISKDNKQGNPMWLGHVHCIDARGRDIRSPPYIQTKGNVM